jgi:autotransporter-associated beta strand protein
VKAQNQIAIGLLLTLISIFLSKPARASPFFQQVGNILVMSNADVTLDYNLNAGTTDFYWQNSKKISAFYSGVTLSTGYIKGVSYSSWSYAVIGSNEVVVTATGSGLPEMEQYFTLDQNDSFLVRVAMVGTNLSANWMGPVVLDSTGWVNIGITNDNHALVVPFDNDGFVTYNAMPMNSSGTGYEVGAFYDNTSRNGLVVGSVTHDTWKTGISFTGANNELTLLNVYGGAMDPWDVMPHGSVVGNVISSPTIFVGFGADWRVTMQNFADENTIFAPRLAWTNGVPFGWNSWGVTNYQQNISYAAAIAVSDSIYVNLMGNNFNDNGTVYVNLDSFWNNLSDSQLQSFVSHCHAHGEKTGIYFGPFVYFGTAAQGSNSLITGSSTYYWSDAYLRTTNGGVQTVDGGIALDPTHPGTQQMINYYINQFTNWGFDYIKLDFLSHGALEGVHYDTNVTTGIQAYNQGMQYVLNQINNSMFISESISPLFPYQYGDSRRIACDAETSEIANTAYTMNSVTYGWWLDNLYQFNDPDIMVFDNGPNTNEDQSRLINCAITGVFLNGSILTNSASIALAQECLTNAAIDNVARVGQTFTPGEGNTGTTAANYFVRQNGTTWYIAVFNYTSSAANETVNLSRAGLPFGNYIATNLWNETTNAIVTNSLIVSLNAKQAKLFQLTLSPPASLKWSPNANSGVWETGISSNWINVSNSQQSVFNTSDQVLFDDTVGVPTNVVVSNTVSPFSTTVNSSTNDYTFGGPGSISGPGSLIKEGASTLSILGPANFTGPVTIDGGTIYAGDFSFTDVASVTITNNSTLDLGGGSYTLPVTVSGAGVNGEGAIYNSYDNLPVEDLNITLTGNTTFGGSQRWDLYEGSISGPYNITINWSNTNGYGEWNTATIATNVGNIELATGALGIKSMGTTFGNPASTFTVDSGTELDFWTGDPGYAKLFHVLTNGLFQFLTSFTTFNGNFTLENGAIFDAFYGSGNQTMNGSFTLNGIAHFILDDANFIFANVISGTGGFVWDDYNDQMIFQAANTYSGPTVIGGSLTLALSGNGSISDSSLIFLGGSNPTNDSLDVGGRPDQTLTLASGQTLAGVGGVGGSLVVSAGATLSPAGTNVTLGITEGTNSTGTIVISNAVTLNGTTVVKLNGSGINDEVVAGGGITYGGTLNLVNISGAPLANGNSFQIFSAASYSGSFANITPATPGAGLAWDISQLNSGIISVVVPSQPVISSTEVSGGNLIFSGTNGVANGTYYVLASTNLATPLTNWTVLSTNTFGAPGTFTVTNAINPGTPQLFYLIQLP